MFTIRNPLGQVGLRSLLALSFAIPALLYFSWQREGVMIAAFCLVLALNTVYLATVDLSRTTFTNLAVIAPLILFGAYIGMSTAPCMIEGAAKQSALFLAYSISAMFPVSVPALTYVTGRKLMDHYPIPEINLGLLPGLHHPRPLMCAVKMRR